jgi:ferrous iron transport protein B
MPDPVSPCHIALVGNPNVGKSVLFNALTGHRQTVGNWPGVTVDRQSGCFSCAGKTCEIVDLPGLYSLLAAHKAGGLDQKIACDYLLSAEPDVIVNVVDGTQLSAHLHLTLQLLSLGLPVILAVNMMDMVSQSGMHLDLEALSERLGCPVVPLIARQSKGLNVLNEVLAQQISELGKPSETNPMDPVLATLPGPLQSSISELAHQMPPAIGPLSFPSAAWAAQRLIEEDIWVADRVPQPMLARAQAMISNLALQLDELPVVLIAAARYALIDDILSGVLKTVKPLQHKAQRLDRWVLHRFWGVPIFFVVMYALFVFAINIGGVFQDALDGLSHLVAVRMLSDLLVSWHAPGWVIALLADGLGQGVNTVITFIPILAGLFFFLSCLEDSGYMARAALVMDRLMQYLGLPGKAFVPMIVGFGCNVPAVMGARVLASRRDRVLTVMMMPFMSCGARLAIFAVFAAVFFPRGGQYIIFSLYCIGIFVALLTGIVLRKTILSGEQSRLVIVLPDYHMPQWRPIIEQTARRLRQFVYRASGIILPISMLLGGLNRIDTHLHWMGEDKSAGAQTSLLATVGQRVTPVLHPMGITHENWPATIGLLSGILAKEVVVGTLNTLYAHPPAQHAAVMTYGEAVKVSLQSIWTHIQGFTSALINPIVASEADGQMSGLAQQQMLTQFDGPGGAFVYLLFVLLYFPCVSTMAVMRRELSVRWAAFSVLWSTSLAYGLSVLCYQGMRFAQHPAYSMSLIAGVLCYFMLCIAVLSYIGRREKAS